MKKQRMVLAIFTAIALNISAHATTFDPNTVVFIGSSTIDFWRTMDSDFAPVKTLNLGKAGTTYAFLLAHAEEWAKKYPAKRYVIYSGDNDLAWLGTPEKVAAEFRELAEILRAGIPDVELYVISIKPNRQIFRRMLIGKVRKANEEIRKEADRLGYVNFVDVHNRMLDKKGHPRSELFKFDGIHLTGAGYRLWTDTLSKELR